MPYYRRLPSGSWQVTVRGPDGRRHTQTDRLKGVVKVWAAEQEARFARGDMRDPRAGEIRVGEWHARRAASRGVEAPTKAKNRSLWATHCEPEWARWPMGAVSRMEAAEWVNRLRGTRRARHQGRWVASGDLDVPVLSAATIHDVVHLMSSLYAAAMKEHPPIVVTNPFAGLELPKIEPRPVEFLEPDEAAALYDAAELLGGPRWRVLIELGTDVGLRPGEMFGLHGHRVDWLRGKIQVVDVMTRTGVRQWPKSKKSHRVAPVPARILEGMSGLMAGHGIPWCSPRRKAARSPTGISATGCGTRRWPLRGSAGSRRGSCGTRPRRGWCRTGCRCMTSRRCSATRTTPQRSGTRTWRRMRTARWSSRGRAVRTHA